MAVAWALPSRSNGLGLECCAQVHSAAKAAATTGGDINIKEADQLLQANCLANEAKHVSVGSDSGESEMSQVTVISAAPSGHWVRWAT